MVFLTKGHAPIFGNNENRFIRVTSFIKSTLLFSDEPFQPLGDRATKGVKGTY
jgi:hypothetical protein